MKYYYLILSMERFNSPSPTRPKLTIYEKIVLPYYIIVRAFNLQCHITPGTIQSSRAANQALQYQLIKTKCLYMGSLYNSCGPESWYLKMCQIRKLGSMTMIIMHKP